LEKEKEKEKKEKINLIYVEATKVLWYQKILTKSKTFIFEDFVVNILIPQYYLGGFLHNLNYFLMD
jgi:hypothetical protein